MHQRHVLFIFLLSIIVSSTTGQSSLDWTQIIEGPASEFDYVGEGVVDEGGNIIFNAFSQEFANGTSICRFSTFKYDVQGNQSWRVNYLRNGAPSLWCQGLNIALDRSGNILSSCVFDGVLHVSKYTPGGQKIWDREIEPSLGGKEKPELQIDHQNNVVLSFSINAPKSPLYVVKLDSNGTKNWTHTFGQGKDLCSISALTIGANSNIYVAGVFDQQDFQSNVVRGHPFIRKIKTDGSLEWQHEFEDYRSDYPRLHSLFTDQDQNVYISGNGYTSSTADEISGFIVKMDDEGERFAVEYWGKDSIGISNEVVSDGYRNLYFLRKDIATLGEQKQHLVTLTIDGKLHEERLIEIPRLINGHPYSTFIQAGAARNILITQNSDYTFLPMYVHDIPMDYAGITTHVFDTMGLVSFNVSNVVPAASSGFYALGTKNTASTTGNGTRDLFVSRYSNLLGLPSTNDIDGSIRFYPNPASGSVHFHAFGLGSAPVDLNVQDVRGVTLKSMHLNSPEGLITLDDLLPGVYICTISNKTRIASGSIVVH